MSSIDCLDDSNESYLHTVVLVLGVTQLSLRLFQRSLLTFPKILILYTYIISWHVLTVRIYKLFLYLNRGLSLALHDCAVVDSGAVAINLNSHMKPILNEVRDISYSIINISPHPPSTDSG